MMDYQALGRKASLVQDGRRIEEDLTVIFDADFACYEVADLEISAEKNLVNLLDYLEHKRKLIGAGKLLACLTLGGKSGREQIATVRPYQFNRDPDMPIKVRVRELRILLRGVLDHETITPVGNDYMEADDIMCTAQNNAIAQGIKTIIVSGDKDLWMVEGEHACPKTGARWTVDGYGSIGYEEVGNVKPKLKGYGTAWFWCQMIQGDTADNIPGLETISNKLWDKYAPLKTGKARKVGSMPCGEAKAFAIIKDCTSDLEAAKAVIDAYQYTYGILWVTRFMEQGYLLWMRRTTNAFDFEHYLEEIGVNIKFTHEQRAIITKWEKEHA